MKAILGAISLALVLSACSSTQPTTLPAPAVAQAPACLKPSDALAFLQSKIGDAAKAEEDLHLTTPDAVQAFAKAMVDAGAPEGVLAADEIVVVRAKLPSGEYGDQESVQFFVKGCKVEGGFVPASAIAALKGDPA